MSSGFLRFLLNAAIAGGLFFAGLTLAEMGDGPMNWPTYHAGLLLLFSILIHVILNLQIKQLRIFQTIKHCAGFVGWILIGAFALYLVEIFTRPGDCCENPVLRVTINSFTILWPLSFAGVAVLGSRRRISVR